ncbi:MAG: hypothetical protein H7842_01570 [Gammaproteobacteria bacterium SHHR-1]|uniref:hypothetical protein n=1 Tax=Magnetovirga frankeli TaxID=947516 RepID=UPI001293523D|nr:hypothetical protein D5125_05085 [gamma proteobacterium SS-5]
MDSINNLKIIGLDPRRPPIVRKEPYIDLIFELSHPAPEDWCDDFNNLNRGATPTVMIKKNPGLFIETYVREMGHIPRQLELIKAKVKQCSAEYLEKIRLKAIEEAAKNGSLSGAGGEQGKLNAILAELDYD